MYGIFGFNLFELVVVVVVSMFVCLFVCFCFVVGVHWGVQYILASIPGRKENGGLVYFVCACAYITPKRG